MSEHSVNGVDEVVPHFAAMSMSRPMRRTAESSERCARTTRRIAGAERRWRSSRTSVCRWHRTRRSTRYLDKLLWVLTGNFAKDGRHGVAGDAGAVRPSPRPGDQRLSAGDRRADHLPAWCPATSIPDEILTDAPGRLQAMIIESGQPGALAGRQPRMARGDARRSTSRW